MKYFLVAIKRFIKNKNTMTIVALLLSLAVLYYAYYYRIEKATQPTVVPYASVKLEPRMLISQGYVNTRKVPGSLVTKNVLMSSSQIVGKYVAHNVEIPQDSLFYQGSVVEWDDLPSSLYEDIPDGHTIVALPVTMETTYGNSIYPGNYIDLYYSGRDTDGKVLIGKFIESIKILAVADGAFNNIFEKSTGVASPSYLIFSVDEDMHLLLRKALYTGSTLFPVPRNKKYSDNPKPTRIVSAYLQTLILSQTVDVSKEDLNRENANNGIQVVE